jgi:carboxyl-terminal processing protease
MPFPLSFRAVRPFWLLLAGALLALPAAIHSAAAPAAPTAAAEVPAAQAQARPGTTRTDNTLITNKAPALVAPSVPAETKRFNPTPALQRTLQFEASALVKNLEKFHYNRGSVKSADYAQVIPNYMGDGLGGLDRQHLFFLAGDRERFMSTYGGTLYFNVKNSGNVNAAYEIFYVYRQRLADRIAWINEALKGDFTFDTSETYETDRTESKTPWPATAAEADELWKRRLKFELLDEVLAAKKDDARAALVPMKDSAPLPAGSLPSAPAVVATEPAAPAKSPLEQAKDTVRKRYERQMKAVDEYDAEDVAERFLNTIAELYDPHSSYQSASSFEDFNIQMRLELVGIGAVLELSKDGDYCTVKEVVPGGPASLDNRLREGDRIVGVAQGDKGETVEVIGWSLNKIVRMIRGDKDTKVRLQIWPAGATDTSVRREYVITRDKVKLDSTRAHGAIFDVPGPNGTTVPYGVISLPLFYGGADDDDKRTASNDVKELVTQMKRAGIKGLALDLRRNGGGLLSEAIDLAGLFIRRGPVVQVKNYDGEVELGVDRDTSVSYDGPLAVVVDRFSASASEIVAGALQNYGRALIIGDSSTHGKGTVQTVQPFSILLGSPEKLGAIKLTIQKFYLPNGSSTQLKGVIPDIVLPSADEYIPNIGERDLDRALVWDEIPSAVFDGKPLDAATLAPLRAASLQRQQALEEFSYLRTTIERFKTRMEEAKVVSLNLKQREQQKASDKTFNDQMKAERDRLAKGDFLYREFWLGEKPKPKTKAASEDPDDPDDPDDGAAYAKMDIQLRETFRILGDYMNQPAAAATRPIGTPTTSLPPAPGGRG